MKRRPLFSLMLIALLTGCASLLPQGEEAPRLFALNLPRPQTPAIAAHPAPVSLQIAQPLAEPGLNSERIALRKHDQEVDYFAAARWTGTVPLLVQSQLVEAFENAQALRTVGSDMVQFHADATLAVEIRDFQVEYKAGEAPLAHVRLVSRLIRGQKQEVISTATYEETEAAHDNRLQDIVAAMNTAFARVSARMVQDITNKLVTEARPSRRAKSP